PGRPTSQVLYSVPATRNLDSLAPAGCRVPIPPGQLVVSDEILTHSEIQVALGIEGQPRQAVVRIIALGVQGDDALLAIRLADSFAVDESKNFIPGRQIDRSVWVSRDTHAFLRSLEEGREPICLAVAVGVLKHANAVAFWSLISLRRKVGMTFDHQQPSFAVEG